MSHNTTKPTKRLCAQRRLISLDIRPVWSESSLPAWRKLEVLSYPLSAQRRLCEASERLALATSDHWVAGSNPTGGKILPKPKQRFIAQNLSCSPFHRLEMTEILLKGHKTLTYPSIWSDWADAADLSLRWAHTHFVVLSWGCSKTGGMPTLIWVFTGCTLILWICREAAQIWTMLFYQGNVSTFCRRNGGKEWDPDLTALSVNWSWYTLFHDHQSISFIAYTNGTTLSVSCFWEQNLEIGQCYTVRHSLNFWTLLLVFVAPALAWAT